ncbi:MAG: hypothetical protein WC369_05210 [Dehalococcoidales bacterium]
MEEFLPGLVRVMEERLGRFGRTLATLVVICLALGASAWGLKLFWDNVIYPISRFVMTIIEVQPINFEDFVDGVVTPLAVFLFFLVIIFTLFQLYIHKKTKKIFYERDKAIEMINIANEVGASIISDFQKLENMKSETITMTQNLRNIIKKAEKVSNTKKTENNVSRLKSNKKTSQP